MNKVLYFLAPPILFSLFFAVMGGLLVAVFLVEFRGHSPKQVVREKTVTVKEAEWATETAEKIKYIYEPRTGLCFAYLSHGNGVALTEVPYEKVKDHLLNPPKDPFEPKEEPPRVEVQPATRTK